MIKRSLSIVKREQVGDSGVFSFTASTDQIDRYGDIINQEGWDLDAYRSNPVILFNHNASALPIGKGEVSVSAENQLMIDIEFDSDDDLGAAIKSKTERGFLHSVSVGFKPIKSIERSKLPTDHRAAGPDGTYFESAELLEVSIVSVPANPQATAAKSINEDFRSEVKSIIRSEMLSIPNLGLRHILSVDEDENQVVVTFAKYTDSMDEVEESGDGWHDEEDEKEKDELKSIDALASLLCSRRT